MVQLRLETHGKAVIVKGDTKPVKNVLKELGGKWNNGLGGWIYQGSKRASILETLAKCGHTIQDATDAAAPAGASSAAAAAPAATKRAASSEGDGAAAKKPNRGAGADGTSGPEQVIEVAKLLHATVSAFHGKTGVDIRRFYLDGSDAKPTPKGVRLGADEWEAFQAAAGRVEAALKLAAGAAERLQIVGDLFVSFQSPGGDRVVDVRKFYTDKADGQQKPTKKGVMLKVAEWEALVGSFDTISSALKAGPTSAGPANTRATAVKATPAARCSDDDEDKPLRPAKPAKAAADLAGSCLKEKLKDMLKGADLGKLSMRMLREELESGLSLPKGALEDRREEIKGIVTDLVAAS